VVCGIRNFLDAFWWRAAVRIVIMASSVLVRRRRVGFVVVRGGVVSGVLVCGASTAGQRQSAHCSTKGQSGHQGQFMHRVSWIDSAYLDSPGRTLQSRRKEPRACARVAWTPAATPAASWDPSIEIYPIGV